MDLALIRPDIRIILINLYKLIITLEKTINYLLIIEELHHISLILLIKNLYFPNPNYHLEIII